MIVHSSKSPIILNEAELKIGKANGYNDIWNKTIQEYAEYICKKLNKNKKIKSIEVSSYKGCSIDIKFDEIKDKNEWVKFCETNIFPVLNDAVKVFSKKYKTEFFWDDKVGSDDGLLVVLDTLIDRKDKITCSCCGKTEGLGDSFSKYNINKNIFYICSRCGDLLYAIKQTKKENDKDAELEFRTRFENRMKLGGNKDLKDWYNKEF